MNIIATKAYEYNSYNITISIAINIRTSISNNKKHNNKSDDDDDARIKKKCQAKIPNPES